MNNKLWFLKVKNKLDKCMNVLGHLIQKCLSKQKSNNGYKYTVDVEASNVHEICLQLPQDTNHVQLCVHIISKLKRYSNVLKCTTKRWVNTNAFTFLIPVCKQNVGAWRKFINLFPHVPSNSLKKTRLVYKPLFWKFSLKR